MNNHVTSLPLSKRLKEAGVEQESEFYWVNVKGDCWCHSEGWELLSYDKYSNVGCKSEAVSAFLTSELLEKLPRENNELGILQITWIYPDWRIENNKTVFRNKSLTEAAGEMLLWVIENGYL